MVGAPELTLTSMVCSPHERRAWGNFKVVKGNMVKEAKRNSRELKGETKKQKHENQERRGLGFFI